MFFYASAVIYLVLFKPMLASLLYVRKIKIQLKKHGYSLLVMLCSYVVVIEYLIRLWRCFYEKVLL